MSFVGNALLALFAVLLLSAALSTDMTDTVRAFSLAALFTILALTDLCIWWFFFRRS